MKRRIFAMLLSLAMLFTLAPTAFAVESRSDEWTTVTLSESGKLEDAVTTVNSNLDTITKLKVTTSGDAVLTPADFQFLSGVVVTEKEDGRYSSAYAVSGTTYLENLTELDLSGARCENNAIPPRAFQRNTKITKIILPDTLERTYLHAFSMMSALTYLGTTEGNLIFPSSMKIMGEGMVYQDANLSGQLTLPASLVAIGSSCFYQSGITGDVVIPGNVNIETNTDISNGEYKSSVSIFEGTRISSLTFKNGITKISEKFAKGCESLTSVTIPASVKTIGEEAFRGTSLTAYPEMAGVTEVGNNAFRELKNVITGDIELKNGVSYGGRVFLGDTINGNVTVNSNSVGVYVFDSTKITGNLTINSETVPSGAIHGSTITGNVTVNSSIDTNTFSDVTINGDLTINSETVPARLLSQSNTAYDSGKARITGTGNVTLGNGVKEVGDGAFNYAAIPGTLTLPEGLEKIGDSAFRKNKLHDNIVIPESVTKIGIAAFSFAGNAENVLNFIVESADPASTLSKYAFAGQASGTKIYFMTAVENKEEYWSGSVVTILNTDGGYVDTTKGDSTTGLFTPSKAGYSFLGWYDGVTKLENAAAVGKTYTAKWTKNTSVALTSNPAADEDGKVSATYNPNGTVTLSVQDPGAGWLYAWMKDDRQITGTESSLTLSSPSESGKYTVKVTAGGSSTDVWTSNAINVTITKANGTASVSMEGWTYGETAKTPVPTSETNGTNGVTYLYKVKDADDSTYSATVPTNVGSYMVKATFPATDNYNETTATADFVIAQATHHSSGSSSSNPTYSVTTPSKSENGKVSLDKSTAKKGDTVTVTVTPDAGYQLDKLTVTDKNGTVLKLTDKGDGKYSFTMPDGKVEVKAVFAKEVETSPFGDVSTDAYYYKAVQWAQEKGITDGISSDLFGPKQPCTRSQIVTFLWRAAGSPEPKGTAAGMTDVAPGSYYAKAVAWAVENGITTGTAEGTFSPDATCTRAQAVTFLARAQNATATGKTAFSDVPADSYFADAVAWAQANGVTTGTSETTFSPDNDCTRAQIVTFLYRANQGT